MALGHHVVLKLYDERVIAPTPAAQRVLGRTALRVGEGFPLVALRAADTHIHLLVACDEATARELARRVAGSLRRALALPVRFDRARATPVVDQRHLLNSFRYVLRQHARHGIASDPLFDASNLPDLLGMRLLGAFTQAHVGALLPRLARPELRALLGVPELDEPRPVSLDDLADAAAGAAGLADLCDRSRAAVAARRAAAQAVAHSTATGATAACATATGATASTSTATHPSARELASALGVGQHAVRKLLLQPVEPALLRAVRLQLRARAALRTRALAGAALAGDLAGAAS
ncbi:MAG: hypothetical protein IT373_19780 [Polyangiaceae bacterium]|nr:hypothetical protein [Polyangiaceae bacterium]